MVMCTCLIWKDAIAQNLILANFGAMKIMFRGLNLHHKTRYLSKGLRKKVRFEVAILVTTCLSHFGGD